MQSPSQQRHPGRPSTGHQQPRKTLPRSCRYHKLGRTPACKRRLQVSRRDTKKNGAAPSSNGRDKRQSCQERAQGCQGYQRHSSSCRVCALDIGQGQQLCAAAQGPSCPPTGGPLWQCQRPAQQQHQVWGGALGVVPPAAVVLTVPPTHSAVAAIVLLVLLILRGTGGVPLTVVPVARQDHMDAGHKHPTKDSIRFHADNQGGCINKLQES